MQKKRRAISRKACDNCRKAHSCCSEPRPCKRCVGLELECIDTPSKKRGRKRKYNLDADPVANLQSDDEDGEEGEPLAKQPKLMVSMDRAIPVHMHGLFPPQQQQHLQQTIKIALPVLRPKGALPQQIQQQQQQQSHHMMAMAMQQQQYLIAPVAQQQQQPYPAYAYNYQQQPPAQQQYVTYQQPQQPQHTPPMIIPQHSLPPIPSPTKLQQQQQQQQQQASTTNNNNSNNNNNSKHQMNNNALSMLLQSTYSEADAKRDILQFLMIEGLTFETCLTLESNPSCNESYVYRNLMNEEAFGTFWSTLERFITSKHHDSPEQSQKYDKVKKLFDIGHKGPTGLCFMHTECAKHFLLERLQDYVKRKTSVLNSSNNSVVTIAMSTVPQQQQQQQSFAALLSDNATTTATTTTTLDSTPQLNALSTSTAAAALDLSLLAPPSSLQLSSSAINSQPDEAYIAQILDFCQMGVFIYLLENGRVILANKTAREVIGLDDDTLNEKAMSWLDMYDGAYLPSTWMQMHQCFTFRPSPSSNTCVAEAVNLQCRNLKTGVMYSMNTHTTIFINNLFSVCRFKVTKSESRKD